MGQAAIPIALALGSAGVGAYNTHRTAKKQDQVLAEGIRKQGNIQRDANRRLNESLAFFEASAPDDIREDMSDKFRTQIRLKRALALSGLEGEGDVSDAFTESAHKAGATALDYGDFLQGVFSRIDSPGEQRRQEGEERTGLGSDLGVFRRQSSGEDFVTRLQHSGIQRNPWLDLLSAGLSGAGVGLGASNAFFGSGTSAPATVPGSLLTAQQFYNPVNSAGGLPGMSSPASLYGLRI